jgi:hypothetical protein
MAAKKGRRSKKLDTGLRINDLWQGDGEVLIGTAELLGANFDVIAVRVQEEHVKTFPNDETGETIQVAVDDPNGYLQDLEGFMQSQRLETVTIPGEPGDWVLWLTPQSCDEDEGED